MSAIPTNSDRTKRTYLVATPDDDARAQLIGTIFRPYSEDYDGEFPTVTRARSEDEALRAIKKNDPPTVLLTTHGPRSNGAWKTMVTEFSNRVPDGVIVIWAQNPRDTGVRALQRELREKKACVYMAPLPDQVKSNKLIGGIPPVLLATDRFLDRVTQR